jgi:hypothetical protein
VSNNPAGRPPKSRALTQLLEKAGSRTISLADGTKVSGKRLLARALWEGVTTKVITFPSGEQYQLPPDEWMTLVQFIYKHIDGPPPQQLQHTGEGGGAIVIDIAHDDPD